MSLARPPVISKRRGRWRACALVVALLPAAAACSSRPSGSDRAQLVAVCLAYDDLRFRDGVELGTDPATREMHARADAACDRVSEAPREVK